MKYCSKCGEQNPDEAKFCSKCGCELISTKTIEIRNEISLSTNNTIEVFKDGQLMGKVKPKKSITVNIDHDSDIELKLGFMSQKYHVSYDNPLSVVCFMSTLGKLKIETASIEGIDRAMSSANDAKYLRIVLIIILSIILLGIIGSEIWDWLSVQ